MKWIVHMFSVLQIQRVEPEALFAQDYCYLWTLNLCFMWRIHIGLAEPISSLKFTLKVLRSIVCFVLFFGNVLFWMSAWLPRRKPDIWSHDVPHGLGIKATCEGKAVTASIITSRRDQIPSSLLFPWTLVLVPILRNYAVLDSWIHSGKH